MKSINFGTPIATLAFVMMTLPWSQEVAGQQTKSEVVAEVVKAARQLLEGLDESQRKKVQFSFTDKKQQRNWSNLPEGIVQRKGLRWGDLNDQTKKRVMNLIHATMSMEGTQQVIDNMDGDETLKAGAGGRVRFGRDEYFFSLLGTPSTTTPWMWQFGGHHLAINATICGDEMTLSPSLTGGQPIDFTIDGRTVRQVAKEEDRAFALIATLTANQKNEAVLSDQFVNMIWGPGKFGSKPKKEGINASKLTAAQQKKLLELIEARIGIINPVHAKAKMKTIRKELDQTWFSWYGDTKPDSAATYRIQGPSVLIEFSPQRLGGKPTDHIHAMYRNPKNDYGAAITNSESKK